VPYGSRAVYRGVAEESVYVDPAFWGRGIGRALLEAIVDASERAGVWTLQASVLPENPASLSLHRALGFREVGVRERIGRHRGRWRDVVLLERRSARAGRDEDG
jgi:phosphinothricin acetyltransferase